MKELGSIERKNNESVFGSGTKPERQGSVERDHDSVMITDN